MEQEQKPTLLVLAAGMGSRFGGLKQMTGLGPNQEVLMEYSIYDALREGFDKVVFVIRNEIEADFNNLVVSRLPKYIAVDFVFQELNRLPAGLTPPKGRTKPFGTAHAIWCAKEVISGNFAVVNADDFYGFSGFEQLAVFFNNEANGLADGALVGFELHKTLSDIGPVTRAVCQLSQDSWLSSIQETTNIEKQKPGPHAGKDFADLVSMNFWGFRPTFFEKLDSLFLPWLEKNIGDLNSEFLLPDAVNELLKRSQFKVKVLRSEDEWIGITYAGDTPSAREKLARLSANGFYPKALWS